MKRSAMKRSQPKRDWTAARAKVDAEGACRGCRWHQRLEAAHIVGREHDLGPSRVSGARANSLLVLPDRIVPLCGLCHGEYDRHERDILHALTTEAYLSKPTLEELASAIAGLRLSPRDALQSPHDGPSGTESLEGASRTLEQVLERLWRSQSLRAAAKEMAL